MGEPMHDYIAREPAAKRKLLSQCSFALPEDEMTPITQSCGTMTVFFGS